MIFGNFCHLLVQLWALQWLVVGGLELVMV